MSETKTRIVEIEEELRFLGSLRAALLGLKHFNEKKGEFEEWKTHLNIFPVVFSDNSLPHAIDVKTIDCAIEDLKKQWKRIQNQRYNKD